LGGIYTQGEADSVADDVIMTSRLSGLSWSEFTTREKPWAQDIIFASTWYLPVCRRGRIVYYLVEFKTI